MSYEITRDFIYIDLPKDIADDLGAVWNQKARRFRLPNTIGSLRDIYKVEKIRNGDTESIIAYANEKVKQRETLLKLKQAKDTKGDDRLRPYQRVDVNYLSRLPHAGIFNEMRTGKTPTSLSLVNTKDFNSIIIVCPAGLVLQWGDEVEKWTRGIESFIITGSKAARSKQYEKYKTSKSKKAMIIGYEMLRNDISYIIQALKVKEIDALIVDEAHRLRGLCNGRNASAQSKAVFTLGQIAKHRYALTGTPTVRAGYEIYGILTFLYPDKFPGYWQFIDRYFEVKDGYFGKEIAECKRQDELEEILTLISTNRKRSEVMEWLPDKTYQTVRLKLEGKQKRAYEDVETMFEYEEDGELKVDAPSVLAQLTRLRQITTSPSMLEINAPSVKEKFIMEWLKDNPDESVLILSSFSSYLIRLQKKIKGSAMITGSVTKPKRKQIEKDFQAGKAKVLLANTKAVQEGLTLDKAETVIFLDKMFNPSENQQAEDRIVPVSKERNHAMMVITLVCKDTYDEAIEFALKNKLNITKIINDAGLNGLKRLIKE